MDPFLFLVSVVFLRPFFVLSPTDDLQHVPGFRLSLHGEVLYIYGTCTWVGDLASAADIPVRCFFVMKIRSSVLDDSNDTYIAKMMELASILS